MGHPFPGNPGHVIYVWMDALTNYIWALGFRRPPSARLRGYWPADIHLIGKDIVRFHAVYWPAFLMAAGIPLPKRVVGHGWWLRNDAKMSKSLGNVVRPYSSWTAFGADALRYYVMREMMFGQDASYSDQSLLTRYNADLANDLGNLVSRAMTMIQRYCGGVVPASGNAGALELELQEAWLGRPSICPRRSLSSMLVAFQPFNRGLA